MKRMKRMLSLVLTGLMLLAMAGCGAKEQSKVLVYEQSGVVGRKRRCDPHHHSDKRY